MLAEIRYYFKIQKPEKLSDSKIIKLYKELEWVRKEEAERQVAQMKLGGF
jgi:hypothetical protein